MAMTFKQFAEHIQKYAEHAPESASFRINGEHVNHLAISLQNPLAEKRSKSGYWELEHDKSRHQVIDLLVNDRDAEPLDVINLDILDGPIWPSEF